MMKKLVLFVCALIIAGASFGQLTGTKNIPGDYATIAAAIADLNAFGVGPGGVTFNVAAGYTETFMSPTAGLITATGFSSSPVVFQKSGMGANPVITAGIGTQASLDGIITMAGGDYFTFDGIDLTESSANVTTTTQMEWGYGFIKARNTFPADGCQYAIIKNCTITLNNTNPNSAGIYSGNHTATSTIPVKFLDPLGGPSIGTLGSSDMMNNCKFYSNTISNVCYGFKLQGYNDLSSPATLFDMNNEVGAVGNGNTISNVGSGSNTTYGIYVDKQTNVKIAYNLITGGFTTGNLIGITPRVSNSVEIHHNTITAWGNASGASGVSGIDNYSGGSIGNTSEIHDNLIQNCFHNGGGSFYAISGSSTGSSVLNIYSNTITGNIAFTGSMYLIEGGAAAMNNIYNNLIYNNTKTGAGSLTCVRSSNYGVNIHDNQIYSNKIEFTGVTSSTGTLSGINSNQSAQTSENIYNNLIYDLNITGTTTGTTNVIYGIASNLPTNAPVTWYNNTVRNLAISGANASGTVTGYRLDGGSVTNVYKNQVYNLTAGNAAGVVHGMYLATGTQQNVYNNFISDLNTPAATGLVAVNGITVASGTRVGIFYNTVFLNASSSATTFGSSGIYQLSTSTLTDLRNNVIMNLCTPGSGGGLTAAFRWNGLYAPASYLPASNSNNFYSGAPAANKVIFYDGINTDQTMAAYQSRVSPKDPLSFSENSPLMNVSAAPYDLHMSTTTPTLCESGGVPVTSPMISDDFDGNPRLATPDVGADEFAGIASGVINPTAFIPAVINSQQIDLPFTLNLAGNNVVIVWNTTGYFTTPSGPPPALNSFFAGGTLLYKGTASPVSHTGLTAGVTYYYKAFSYDGTSYSTGVPANATTNIAPPTAFAGYGITSSRIDLSLTRNAANNNVIIATNSTNTFGQPLNGTTYSANPGSNTLPTAGTVIYVGPLAAFSHTGLAANTAYYYKAWSVDAFAWYSPTGPTTNATTLLCGPASAFPYNETFDTYVVPAIGCGTTVDANADGSKWVNSTATTPAAQSSPNHLKMNAAYGTTNDDWYFLQGLTLTAGLTYKFSFWYRPATTNGVHTFEVKWGTAPSPVGMYSTPLFSKTAAWNPVTYTEAVCFVTPATSGTYYFGWHSNVVSPYSSVPPLYIDNIKVETNTCVQPLTVSSTGITATSANIGWTGDATEVDIDYGTAGHAIGTNPAIRTTSNPYLLSTLSANTTYEVYVRKVCDNILEETSFWTGPVTFTTTFIPPTVTTGAASLLTGTGATLNATVSTNGTLTTAYFDYGLTTSYGASAVASQSPLAIAFSGPVTAVVSGLTANGITYHFRAVGYSNNVLTYGADQTFVTTAVVPTAPAATSTTATSITSTGATLNGTVNPNNASTTVTFEYGLNTAYGTTVTATQSPVNGNTATTVSSPISGLDAGVLYHYRVVAANSAGTTNGLDMTFTASDLPTVTTTSYTWSVGATTATLKGTVNANGYNTTVTFQWGLTTAYTGTLVTLASPVTGITPTDVVSTNITVALNSLYHYRVVGVNSAGTAYGADMTFTTPTPPTFAATTPVPNYTNTSGVTLFWTSGVNPNNAVTTVNAEYGLTTTYGSTQAATATLTGTTLRPVTMIIPTTAGLSPGTLYHYRINASNAGGAVTSADYVFTTPPVPTVTTLAATPVGSITATMKGNVVWPANTPAVTTAARYEYGLTTAYGTTLTPSPNSNAGSTTATTTLIPNGALTGLLQGTTYYYRLYALNSIGTYYGAGMSFTTTAVAPTVNTIAPSGIIPDGAILNGTINANNASTTAGFEYGLTTAYGSTVTASPATVTGVALTGVNAPITGLLPNTVYHYRATGTNIVATTNGGDQVFTTLALLPTVTTTAASMVEAATATINGTVNANNASTSVVFQYGLTTAYGSTSAPAVQSPVTGASVTDVSGGISGLLDNTIYHYRTAGTNVAGTGYGTDFTFRTQVASLTGIKNIPGAGGPNDYFTIAAAIADLNFKGVGPGGVTFNVAAGYTETFMSPTAGLITATGTAANQVIFQKSGMGANPVITAGIGNQPSIDGIITFAGSDYFTFDGIDVIESASNINATTQMEWGYGFVKARRTLPADGCQYVTIKNCTITLNNANSASAGIYSGNHTSSSSAGISFVAPGSNPIGTVGSSDMMNNCKFYNNVISNVCYGFRLNGYNEPNNPPTLYDLNNEIGALGAGNTISNIGSSNYNTYGIFANYQNGVKMAYNTVTGGGTTGNLTGISPKTSTSANIHHNTVSLTMSASAASSMYAIDGEIAGTPGNTVEIHHNTVQNCTQYGSGQFTGIRGAMGGAAATCNIYSNVITGNSAANGPVTLLESGFGVNNNIYDNIVHHNTKTGAGQFMCLKIVNYNTSTHDNQIYSNNINTTGVVVSPGTLYGINCPNYQQTSETVYNNLIYDLNITGTITSTGNNLYGINSDNPSGANRSIYNNVVRDLAINGPNAGGTVYGIKIENGTTSNVYKNQFYNLKATGAGSVVHGMYIGVVPKANVYNNFVSDLQAPASVSTAFVVSSVNGITIGNGTNIGLYFNTVYLNASSSGTNFGTTGINNISGINTVADIRSNLIMNLSTPGTTGGLTVAYRLSSVYNPVTYSSASNANNFYAGTPSANRLVYSDGINSDQTITAYQARVYPKDALSFSENSPLMNTTTAPYDLHMNATMATLCESSGVPVMSPAITDDFDGNLRAATPDVGADEFEGIVIGVINPTAFVPSVLSSQQISLPFILNPAGNDVVIVWNTTGLFSTPSGTPPALNSAFAGGTLLSYGSAAPVNHSGLTGSTTYYYKAFSYNGTSYSTGVPATATTTIAPPTAFAGYGITSSRIDLSLTRNAVNNNVIIATNSTSTFGQPLNGTTYSANPGSNTLPTAGTVIYVGPLAAFSHTGLAANTTYYYKAWSVDAFAWYSPTGPTTNATTLLCGPSSTMPYNETFDTYVVPAIGCGTTVDVNGDGIKWVNSTATTPTAQSSPNHLRMNAPYGTKNDDWYFLQGLNLTAGLTYKLSFWYRPLNTNGFHTFEVKWGTAPSPVSMYSTPLFSKTASWNPVTYTEAVCIVTPATSGTYYFGWHSNADATFSTTPALFIDNIKVETNPCVQPLTVTSTGITATSATIGWTGDATEVDIDYGTVGHTIGTNPAIRTTSNPYLLSTLAANTAYEVYVRKVCDNILEETSFWTGPVTFTTLFIPPTITTGSATALTGPGATLNGTVSSNGTLTTAYFEYGVTTSYGSAAIASQTPMPLIGTYSGPITSVISGLVANGTTYHFRAVGFSNGVAVYGADQTFITPPAAPTVTTTAATAFTGIGATLNGTVNANNTTASAMFEYGLTTAYGSNATAVPSTVAGITTTVISAPVTGLVAGSVYHYRATATNEVNTTPGNDITFFAQDPATVTTGAYTWTPATTNGTLVLNGTVNALGYSTTVTFQYGLTTAYGTNVNAVPNIISSNTVTPVANTAITLSSSSLNNLYHYRTVATNQYGVTYGPDATFTTTIFPLATTSAATAVNYPGQGINLNASVNCNNLPTTVSWEYGLTTGYGSNIAHPLNPLTGTSTLTRTVALPGLPPATPYNYRVIAVNAAGTTLGANMTFTTPNVPIAVTTAATLITSIGARVNGTINANNVGTTYPATPRFEYGLTTAYGINNSSTPSSANGTTTGPTYSNLSGLLPNTLYHYRTYGQNCQGISYGEDMTFTTLAIAPNVATTAAYSITNSSAQLNGTVNANNSSTEVTFEYGLTTGYGSTATSSQSPVNGATIQGVSAGVTGLQPNQLYHYRAKGVNGASPGTTYGSDMTFTTLTFMPDVVTTAPNTVTAVSAILNGTVNANNASTTVKFEYGLTTDYGMFVTPAQSPVTGSTPVNVDFGTTGLAPATVYHYRAVGVNIAGTGFGYDMILTTLPLLITNDQSNCSPDFTFDLTLPEVTAGSILNGSVLTYWLDANATLEVDDPTSVGPGTYYIMAYKSATSYVVEPVTTATYPLPAMYNVTGGGSYCAGGPGAAIGLSGSETGMYYSLWNPYGQVVSPIPGTGSPISFGPQTGTGYYMVLAVNGTSGCINWMYNFVIVSISQPDPVSVTIATASNVVPAGQDVTFTATPVNGGSTPSFAWLINGFGAGTNSATFTCQPVNGDQVSCVVTSSGTCVSGNPATSNVITMTVSGVAANITVTGTVPGGETRCYNALQTMTVAGNGTTFIVDIDGSATMIAGQNIIYLPGTLVQPGGYMHGYISNDFCGTKAASVVTEATGNEKLPLISQSASFKLYPNPTSGNFTLVQKSGAAFDRVTVEVYSIRGEKVMTEPMIGEQQHEFRFSDMNSGLYFVKIIAGDYVETIKLVKTR